MRPQSAKAKGRRFQQWIRGMLLATADGVLEQDDIRSTSMGASGEDLLLSPLARKVYPLSIECKNQERLNIWAALAQTVANTWEGRTPVLFFSRNRESAWACLPAEELAHLYFRVYSAQGDKDDEA